MDASSSQLHQAPTIDGMEVKPTGYVPYQSLSDMLQQDGFEEEEVPCTVR